MNDDDLPFPTFAASALAPRESVSAGGVKGPAWTPEPAGYRRSPPRQGGRSPPRRRDPPPRDPPQRGRRQPTDPKGTIPQERQHELREAVRQFLEGGASTKAMPSSLSGLERKLVHLFCEEYGVDTQSFGEGAERAVHLIRRQTPSEPVASSVESPTARRTGGVTYSAVVLEEDSRERLVEGLQKHLPEWGTEWTKYAHHMTICLGPLSEAASIDRRGVAEKLQRQVRALTPGSRCELRCVSIGRTDAIVAAGVVGCCSTNRTPHITVAVARGHRPQESNAVEKWSVLPEDEQVVVVGTITEVPSDGRRTPTPPRGERTPPRMRSLCPGDAEQQTPGRRSRSPGEQRCVLAFADPTDGAEVRFFVNAERKLYYEVGGQRRPPLRDADFGQDESGPFVEFPCIDTELSLPCDFSSSLKHQMLPLFDAHGVSHNLARNQTPPRGASPVGGGRGSPVTAAPPAGPPGASQVGGGRGSPVTAAPPAAPTSSPTSPGSADSPQGPPGRGR
eukprot:Hpha_TRINITY_DN4457_c0_g1::TRINITY_DN4457_c0_g1_i1::g.50328::m.50328